MNLLNRLSVVLVRAENPINIGQSARAMKNFGTGKLILANCAPHRVPDAYTPGWKARNILDKAKRLTSLRSALRSSMIAVGFTARAGKRRGAPRPLADVVPDIVDALRSQNVALVFGNEKNGLSNEEIKQCHWMVTIPSAREYSSLNLSHAVAIVLALVYSKTSEARNLYQKPERFHTKPWEFDALMEDFRQVLKTAGYRNTPKMAVRDQALAGLSRYFKKSGLDRRELHLFKAFLSRIRQII